jgi:excisionase family DNA binding protein
MADEFLSVAEVAELLKLNKQTVYNWVDAGTLPSTRIGRRVRIRREDFDALVGGSESESDDDFLTVAEVAATLRLNQQTVRNWIDAGKLPAARVGRRVRIRRTEIDAILERGSRGTSPSEVPTAEDFWDRTLVAEAVLPN